MNQRNFGNVRPRLKRVAAFTIFAERAVVRIAVAGFAVLCCTGEFERSMASFAIHERMLSLQHEAGFLVLEFYIQTQGLPCFGRMAIAARNFDIAVRMIDRRDLRSGGTCHQPRHKQPCNTLISRLKHTTAFMLF